MLFHRRPKLTVVPPPPADPAEPAIVRRLELNTLVAAVVAGHLLAGALIKRGKAGGGGYVLRSDAATDPAINPAFRMPIDPPAGTEKPGQDGGD